MPESNKELQTTVERDVNELLISNGWDYDKELSGRELDFAIAERLMEWTWWSLLTECYLVPPFLARTFSEHSAWGWQRGKTDRVGGEIATQFVDYSHVVLPRYSQSIEAAMQIVTKLSRRTEVDYFPDTVLPWCVMFVNAQTEAAWAKTLPEAICRAALAAMETKE